MRMFFDWILFPKKSGLLRTLVPPTCTEADNSVLCNKKLIFPVIG